MPPACEVAFLTAYADLKRTCATELHPGVAVVAIDEDGAACTASFVAKSRTIQTAIVGRHSSCDVFLPGDDTVSLRHLALVLHPHAPGERVRYRLVDLRTSSAFQDERGHRVEHLVADGPLMVYVGAYALMIFPTGDRARGWPEDPMTAWKALPAREYSVGEQGRRPLARRLPAAFQDPDSTGVQLVPGPRFAVKGLASEDEVPLGELRVESSGGATSFVLGRSSARGGVLLGRYDRCDSSGLPVLQDYRISRVHVLLLEVDGALYLIDTASTNGVWSRSAGGVRQHALKFGEDFELGRYLARLRWSPVH